MKTVTQEKPLKITLPNLLDSPDFFVCKRFNCIMSKISCVKRQQKSYHLKESSSNSFFFPNYVKDTDFSLQYCKNCLQGRRIKKELENQTKTKEVPNGN